jgi:hypothetical protein
MALYNHLFAKKHGGKWLLRIEDTDMVCLCLGVIPACMFSNELGLAEQVRSGLCGGYPEGA